MGMRRIAIEELAERVSDLQAWTPKGQVLLTRKGKPFGIVSDASSYDEEDIGYITSPAFWRMIAERRREPTIPFEEVKARLGLGKRRQGKRTLSTTGKKRKS